MLSLAKAVLGLEAVLGLMTIRCRWGNYMQVDGEVV